MNKNIKVIVGVSVFSLVATAFILYFIEIASFGVRYFSGTYLSNMFSKSQMEKQRLALIQDLVDAGAPVDRRPASQVIREMKAEGRPVFEFLNPGDVYEFSNHAAGRLGLGGLSSRSVLAGGEFGPWAINTHDQHGLNNRSEDWQKPDSTVFVGASMVYGFSVEREKTFVDLLRQKGRAVINLAYPGLGVPDAYLGQLQEFIAITNAKYIVWSIWDDIEANLPGKNYDIVEKYHDVNFKQDLASNQIALDNAYLSAIEPFIKASNGWKFQPTVEGESHLSDIVHLRNLRLVLDRFMRLVMPMHVPASIDPVIDDAPKTCTPERVARHLKILETARRIADPYGAKIIVTFYPIRQRMKGNFKGNDYCYQDILKAAGQAGYGVIDLYQLALSAGYTSDDLYHPRAGGTHFTEKGHRIIAELLDKSLPR